MSRTGMEEATRSSLRSAWASLFALVVMVVPQSAVAKIANPLAPPDRSSPRATLTSLIDDVNQGWATFQEFRRKVRQDAPDEELDHLRTKVIHHVDRATKCLDLSEVPKHIVSDVAIERVLQLKETFDRIQIPRGEDIPDAEEMAASGSKRWTLPHTEIEIALVEEGPNAGQYLFTPATLARTPEFYKRVRNLPYRPGATEGAYEYYIYTPGGLVPSDVYWAERLPGWARVTFLEQAGWQWLGLGLCVLVAFLVLAVVWRATRWRGESGADRLERRSLWRQPLRPAAVMLVVSVLSYAIDDVVNITGDVLNFLLLALGAVFYGALVAGIWIVGGALAEAIITTQQLRVRSINSQLIRLGLRLCTLIIAAGITVEGAQRLGLPAYSVLTGLGIGGLAFALAARDSLANLLGSLVIMFERSVRVGDWVKVGEAEGTVEDVGFRSTRIRTFYNSLISIPNADLVNAILDNMGMRRFRRVRTFLHVTYDTPVDKLEEFTEAVRQLILAHPTTRQKQCHVIVQNFAESGIEIMLYFFLEVPDWSAELADRQKILVKVMRKAEELGVRFALPTRTLHVESLPAEEERRATEDAWRRSAGGNDEETPQAFATSNQRG